MTHGVWVISFGHLGLQCAGQVEVPPDGIVVGTSTKCHKEVPDGMGKGNPPVTLEEHHAQAVEDPSCHQLPDALSVGHGEDDQGREKSHHHIAEQLHKLVPFMEEKDIDSTSGGHDPDQPAHVGGPGAQLPEVQPRSIGSRDEEVNDHPVDHVQAVFYHPEVALLPGDCVENGGYYKEATEAKAIDPGRYGFPVIVRQEVEVGAAKDAGNDPESMGSTVGCVFILCGLVPLVCRDSVIHKPCVFGFLEIQQPGQSEHRRGSISAQPRAGTRERRESLQEAQQVGRASDSTAAPGP